MKAIKNIKQRGLNITLVLATLFGIQTISANATLDSLAPDQNPNYKRSLEKYMAIKDDYIKKEGTTIQNTYKAIDDMEAKKERRALRKERRHERRMARINNRRYYNNCYSPYYYGYNSFNNYGWDGYYHNRPYGYNNWRYNNACRPYTRPHLGLGVSLGWGHPRFGMYYGNSIGFWR
jgi:hypothetical protein